MKRCWWPINQILLKTCHHTHLFIKVVIKIIVWICWCDTTRYSIEFFPQHLHSLLFFIHQYLCIFRYHRNWLKFAKNFKCFARFFTLFECFFSLFSKIIHCIFYELLSLLHKQTFYSCIYVCVCCCWVCIWVRMMLFLLLHHKSFSLS